MEALGSQECAQEYDFLGRILGMHTMQCVLLIPKVNTVHAVYSQNAYSVCTLYYNIPVYNTEKGLTALCHTVQCSATALSVSQHKAFTVPCCAVHWSGTACSLYSRRIDHIALRTVLQQP